MSHPIQERAHSCAANSIPASIYAGVTLAWLGTLITILLLWQEGAASSFLCASHGGCETVIASVYSDIRGVPLPVFGLVFYLLQLALWLGLQAISKHGLRLRLLDAILGLAFAGATFSAGLMAVQFGVLHAFCPLCTASALTAGALLVAAIRARRRLLNGAADHSRAVALAFAGFAILSLGAFGAMYFASSTGRGGVQLLELSAGHRIGPVDAAVQLSVFSDYQCEFCRKLAPDLKRLVDKFPGDLAITYRHFPLALHPRAYPAATAAECAAEQGAFAAFSEKLYAQDGALQESDFLSIASALGLDQARFLECLHSGRPEKTVEANLKDAERLGLEGVPVVFLNGRRIRGPFTYETLVQKVQSALHHSPKKN
jgi:protein-disulfide isomerase/uncharacterized membrane protein